MRIACPYCGENPIARVRLSRRCGPAAARPRQSGRGEAALTAAKGMFEYVYMRDNVPGRMRELWQHAGGCRAWLVVERDVSTTTRSAGRSRPRREPAPGGTR